jgi:hypothetical protein
VVSTARIERPLFYRGGSASKETMPAASLSLSEAARCASKGIVPATPSPIFSILLILDRILDVGYTSVYRETIDSEL